MKKTLFLCIVVLCACTSNAQHNVAISIKKSVDKEPFAGATTFIVSLRKTSMADCFGVATFVSIPAGTYQVNVSYVGMAEQEITIQVPHPGSGFMLPFSANSSPEITSTRVGILAMVLLVRVAVTTTSFSCSSSSSKNISTRG